MFNQEQLDLLIDQIDSTIDYAEDFSYNYLVGVGEDEITSALKLEREMAKVVRALRKAKADAERLAAFAKEI
ncbi:MAG: hypothetical protein M0019_07380 [Actinomycetota bacterium]|nr:hypothetical protein [Actinomycetota bacterium]